MKFIEFTDTELISLLQCVIKCKEKDESNKINSTDELLIHLKNKLEYYIKKD